MTKPVVWVQFTVKKNRVDDKNLLHLKYLTCQKLQLFFSVLRNIFFLHRLFCVIPQLRLICSSFEFRSYYDKSDDFEQEEPRKLWKLIYMASHKKNKSGTKCWPTCLYNLKSATILSNGGKPENVL